LAVFATLIPRSVWPDKPQIGLGSIVKNDIFHEPSRGGYPSGLIAEGWINFGTFGLFLPLFLIGWLMRFVYESARPLLGKSFYVTLLYAAGIWQFGFFFISANFAHGLILTLIATGPMFVLLWIARKKPTQRVMLPQAVARQT
jgi:hypothetical protein